jgi:hypothetical protein
VDQILMPLIQPMRLPAGTGWPDPARPAAMPAQHLKNAEREAPAVLFQPGRVHRPGPFEERQADQPAMMIHLGYAMSEPCGRRGVSGCTLAGGAVGVDAVCCDSPRTHTWSATD